MDQVVRNMPDYAWHKNYVVARECDGDYWFWGGYDKVETAIEAANEIHGEVFAVKDECDECEVDI